MKKTVKIILFTAVITFSISAVSCRDTNPNNNEPDMGMTSDSVFNQNDSINNNESTTGADTELDGE